jgi:adenine-specific DNA-methyltransferase
LKNGNIKDLILFYTKTKDYVWNDPTAPLDPEDVVKRFNKVDEQGRRYTTIPLHAPGETKSGPTGQAWKGMLPPEGRHWRSKPAVLDDLDKQGLVEWSKNGVPRKIIFAEDKVKSGKKVQDIWEYKDPQYPQYPTEKNLDLIKFIVASSSNEDDLVFDCFAGSGSTLVAAQSLNRNWLGIDQSAIAIDQIKNRLNDQGAEPSMFDHPLKYEISEHVGSPPTEE